MGEATKKTYEEMFNKKERLKVIKQGILNFLNRVGESRRDLIENKLHDLLMDQNPYDVFYRGAKSRKILVNPTKDEINYCLNYLKRKNLIEYNEQRKIWMISGAEERKKKRPTLEKFFNQ
ncbi:MAG: hypothetical protein ACTSYB_13530 [Candidatus Helarchaeota archaeon]